MADKILKQLRTMPKEELYGDTRPEEEEEEGEDEDAPGEEDDRKPDGD